MIGQIAPDVEAVLRAQGAALETLARRSPPALRATQRAVDHGAGLLQPVVVSGRWQVACFAQDRLSLCGGGFVAGPLIGRLLSRAEHIAVAICTIGPKLEETASAAFLRDAAYATALDAFGSCAVQNLAQQTCSRLSQEAGERRLQSSIPLSPGLEGWPVMEGQRQLFDLMAETGAGVFLNSSGQMSPRKSMTLLLGFGNNMQEGDSICDYCGSRKNCRQRPSHA